MALVDWSDPAAEQVLRLVCGLAPHKMATRRLMALQAFIDDSKEEGKVTVLAGYMSDAQKWIDFSRDWNRLLTIRPEWSRFKMSEVMTGGGTESLERAMFHYRAIEDHVELGFCVAVPHASLSKVVREFNMAEKWENPYYMAYIVLISVIRHYTLARRPGEAVKITFDTQLGEYRTVLDAWDLMVERNGGDIRPFSSHPSFEKDEDYLPLQAADLLAWHVRKKFKETGSITRDGKIFPWPTRVKGPHYVYAEVDEAGMRRHIRNSLNPYLRGYGFGSPVVIPGPSYLR